MLDEIEKGQGVKPLADGSTYSIIAFPASALPKQYEGLVYSRWLRSFKSGNRKSALIFKAPNAKYYPAYHQHIENLMAKPSSVVRLAVLSDNWDVVLGFSVCREDVLDYVHVQAHHRRHGIATKLVPRETKATTHMTDLAKDIWLDKYPYIKFNPHI